MIRASSKKEYLIRPPKGGSGNSGRGKESSIEGRRRICMGKYYLQPILKALKANG